MRKDVAVMLVALIAVGAVAAAIVSFLPRKTEMLQRTAAALAILAMLTISACTDSPSAPRTNGAGDESSTGSALPQGAEPITLDPADFTTKIDNPYWPMTPGTKWVYVERGPGGTKERVVVTVTDRTKTIAGIEARVVRDRVSEHGETIEDTFDWYAQDSRGNTWYLGEDTREYENGTVVTTEGSWEHGVDGALAGIIVPAEPEPGMSYRQEYYKGHAEDVGAVLSLDEFAYVPAGGYDDLLMTRDTSAIERKVLEYKFYAQGIGPVMEATVSPGSSRAVLIQMTP